MLLDYVNREYFPKFCPNCNKRYENDEQYTRETVDKKPIFEEEGKFNDHGLIAFFRNCQCNSTLVISLEKPERFGLGIDDFLNFTRYRLCPE